MNKFFFCFLNFHLDYVYPPLFLLRLAWLWICALFLIVLSFASSATNSFGFFLVLLSFALALRRKFKKPHFAFLYFISQAINNYKSWNENLLLKRLEDEMVCLISEVSLTKFSCLSVTAIDLSSLALATISLVASGLIVLITAIRKIYVIFRSVYNLENKSLFYQLP